MGGLIGIAVSVLPSLLGLANGPMGEVLKNITSGVAHKVFGTNDPEEIKRLMAEDANKLEAFKSELAAQTDQLRIVHEENVDMRAKQVEDIGGARQQMMELNKAGSAVSWGAPIVSIIIVSMFVIVSIMLFFLKQDLPEKVFQLLQVVFGALIPMCSQVVNFWLGSSFSGQRKDDTIARQAMMSASSTPPAALTKVTSIAEKALGALRSGNVGGDANVNVNIPKPAGSRD
jgi:uncharacterized integral membrane protein